MNAKERSVGRMGLMLSGALAVLATGCATHVHQRTVYVPAPVVVTPPPPPVVETPTPAPLPPPAALTPVPPASPVVVVQPPAPTPVVVIQSEKDFYEPLNPYGRWVVVPGYGYSWVPAHVENDWRPYSNGYWQRTDAGWYWMSEEPWGWATYHYGRWDWNVQFGWFWVPQTQWAPAWVAWREGGGYVGWAPLRPSVAIGVSLTSVNYEPAFASRAYVFVEHRHLTEPVRPKTVVVNNTTIIHKTVNITRVSVVNKTVINEGPRPDVIERESGRKIHSVAVRDFRHREETAVVERNRNLVKAHEAAIRVPVKAEHGTQPTQTPGPRKEQLVVKTVGATRSASAPDSVTTTPKLPARPNRDELPTRNERKVVTPTNAREQAETKSKAETAAVRNIRNRPSPRSAEKPVEFVRNSARTPAAMSPVRGDNRLNAERAASPVSESAKVAPGNPAKSEVKGEAKPQLTNSNRPSAPSPEIASKRAQMSPREKSRAPDRAGVRGDDRGEKRERQER